MSGWTLDGDHDWSDCSVDFGGGGYHYTIYEEGRERPVAFVIGMGDDHRDGEESRKEAMAMAAAPEVLEALILARDLFVNGESACAEICDAAIAKATGEAQ